MNEIIAPNKNDCQWLQAGILWCRVLCMSNEEIDKLEAGLELDALVAEKVMRWRVHPRNTAHWMLRNDDDIDYLLKGQVGQWRPSINIAAAWEVVEKLADDDLWLTLNSDWYGKLFVACFRRKAELVGTSLHWTTAPVAICRAALKAVNHE
jgi:hypothetical protein